MPGFPGERGAVVRFIVIQSIQILIIRIVNCIFLQGMPGPYGEPGPSGQVGPMVRNLQLNIPSVRTIVGYFNSCRDHQVTRDRWASAVNRANRFVFQFMNITYSDC